MIMITFCTRVECKQAVPFCSLMKARILLDAYFTLSPSKVAVITHAPTPLEIVWESRTPDPIWVTALKIVSYVVLAPLALLALCAKCALYCKPLHTYAPRITKEIPQSPLNEKPASTATQECEPLCDFIKRGEDAGHPKVQAAIAKIISQGEKEIKSTLRQLKDVFKSSFPKPGVKRDYQNGSLLTKQQKTYVKNYIAIKTQLVKAFLPKDDFQWQYYLQTEIEVVRDVVCCGWDKMLSAVYYHTDNYMTGYAALKAYYQDALECYAVAFTATGVNKNALAARARAEVMSLLIHMATTHWTGLYLTFFWHYYDVLGEDRIAQVPQLHETCKIIRGVCIYHEQQGKGSVDLCEVLDQALA